MGDLDRAVWDAKSRVTAAIRRKAREDTKDETVGEIADAIDGLNKAWDALTDALVRQREERGREVLRLLDALAEAKR